MFDFVLSKMYKIGSKLHCQFVQYSRTHVSKLKWFDGSYSLPPRRSLSSQLIEKHEKRDLAKSLLQYIDSNIENYSQIGVIQNLRNDLDSLVQEISELEQMTDDPELKCLAESDLEKVDLTLNDVMSKASTLIIPGREFDYNNAIMEVHAGVGGGEASVFAEQIFHMYLKYAKWLGHTVVLIQSEVPPESGLGIQKASASIEGRNVFQNLKYECGVHRVQRVPLAGTKNDRLQTSTCSVAILPQLSSDEDMKIPESELKYEYMRSGGAGGQSVNTNDTACRITHIPTGISFKSQEERSQSQNKKTALNKLKSELFKRKFESQMAIISRSRKSQIGNMNRNEKIRTYNYSRNQLSDHRLGLVRQVSNMDDFIEGRVGFEVFDFLKEKLQIFDDYESLKDFIRK